MDSALVFVAMEVKSWLNRRAVAIHLLYRLSRGSRRRRLILPVSSSICVVSWHLQGQPNRQAVPVACFRFFASPYLTHTAPQICFCVLAATKSESSCNSLAHCSIDSSIEGFGVCKRRDFSRVTCLTREGSEISSEKVSSINASTCSLYSSLSSSLKSSRRLGSRRFAKYQRNPCKWSIPRPFDSTTAKYWLTLPKHPSWFGRTRCLKKASIWVLKKMAALTGSRLINRPRVIRLKWDVS